MSTPGTTFTIAFALITLFDLLAFLTFLTLIVPPLVAVIVGARLGDTGKISFLSWFLTAIISSVVYLLLLMFGVSPLLIYLGIPSIILVIIGGLVNGIFYGCFSFLFSKGGL